MKYVKIKANHYAEVIAQAMDSGELVYLGMETRVIPTAHGDLFRDLLREATRSGKFDSPKQMVDFCATVAGLSVVVLSQEPAFAIEVPPRSAINRKIAKSFAQGGSDE